MHGNTTLSAVLCTTEKPKPRGGWMHMTFYFGNKALILFDGWRTTTDGQIVGSCICIFIAAFLYEGLKVFREWLHYVPPQEIRQVVVMGADQVTSNTSCCAIDRTKPPPRKTLLRRLLKPFKKPQKMFSIANCVQTFLHMLQVTLSYALMLVWMTFNGWLCLCAIAGGGLGYFLFGHLRDRQQDKNECCN